MIVGLMVDRGRQRWTLRCRDLLSRDAFVVTELDAATDEVLLQITGSKAVRLADRDVQRLIRHLAEARSAARDGPAAS